ncbi:MAG: GlsB/YeaQ/YmgE family stress response membrane protein [Nocardioides sp.]|nr:GlsB/YeaQ/YmgE family stress response membrane protein [Nocardioides sp.]
MLILAIILFGMLVGAGAQLILGRERGGIDWTMAIVAGLVGSFIGGLLVSLLSGDGLALRPSGIIGSLGGALIVTGAWRWMRDRQTPTAKNPNYRSGNPAKRNQAK